MESIEAKEELSLHTSILDWANLDETWGPELEDRVVPGCVLSFDCLGHWVLNWKTIHASCDSDWLYIDPRGELCKKLPNHSQVCGCSDHSAERTKSFSAQLKIIP